MSDKLTKYMTRLLPDCMLTYQFIEESLRHCLVRYHAIIVMKLDSEIHYEIPLDSINKAAMGRLIQFYKSFNKDSDFLKRLNKIKGQRDEIAHQGYVLTYEEQNNEEFVSGKYDETECRLQEAKLCLEIIQSEVLKLEDLANKVASEKAHNE